MRLSEIQQQIGRGSYQVDAQAVADAILLRLLQKRPRIRAAPQQAQAECS